MSGPQARPFKGRLGFDANNDKVVNLADPTDLQDGLNLRYFIANNTTQTFDPTRAYAAGFLVEYSDRLFKSKAAVTAGPFNLNQWTEIHAFGRWLRVTGAYNAEPGDNLFVGTQAGSVSITLPFPAEDGDIVTILDEGFAKTNPIVVIGGTNTINGIAGNYAINNQDICQFIYFAGTWKVSREEKSTFQYVSTSVTLQPNSFNLVQANPAKTLLLPANPIQGQWVTLVDASNDMSNYYNTIGGNGKTINGAASLVMNRFGAQVTCVYDATYGEWKAVSNMLERRIPEAINPPLPSQTVSLVIDGTTKLITLPATAVTGDWVELVSTTPEGFVAGGSIVVTASAGTYFRTTSSAINTTTYRIKRRGKTMFLLRGTEWSIVQLENGMMATNVTTGTLLKNTLATLTGSASNTIYLPTNDTVQIGDFVSAQLNTSVGRVLVSVSDTTNDQLDAVSTVTYLAADNGMVVTFVYRGWNGTKNVWETINHGSAYLKKSQNLNDLPDKAVSRTNLDVFSKGESDLRFLPLHGTADNAAQAANADKLDGLHAVDFIQVKNPSATAVDANSTTETRFTTNVNTPDATLWQVVMFVDAATGSKSQIAMNPANNQIAYRSFGSAWSAWARMDQGANAASATKLQTPRTINSVPFDGTANIEVQANPRINWVPANTDMNVYQTPGFYQCAASATAATLTNCPTTNAFSMIVTQSAGFTQTIREYGTAYNKSWYRSVYNGVWDSWKQIYDEANPQPNVTGNAGTASKWATPRKLSLTGGVTGEVNIDGSGDVTITTSIVPTAGQFDISNVNGLQGALDSKLPTTGTAADSAKLGGVEAAAWKLGVIPGNSGENPNTTLTTTILTNHANTPDGGTSYWYIDTEFYANRTVASNRFQVAKQYNGGASVYIRNCYNNVWSGWGQLASLVPGSTLPINVTGSAGTSGSADKLSTPRTINGVAFDGTANITVSDSSKLPLTGGSLTGSIKRAAGSGVLAWKTIDSPLTKTLDSTNNGTMMIKLPVGLNNTMMKFTISVFSYATNTSFSIDVSGYNYSTGWINCSAQSSGTNPDVVVDSVRFAKDATNAYILIGSTSTVWQYPKVTIRNVELGYSGATDSAWDGAWDVLYSTTETGITVNSTNQLDPWIAKLGRNNTFTQPQTINLAGGGTYFRSITGNYGVLMYQDTSNWYLMKTASGAQTGGPDAARPMTMSLSSGDIVFGTNVSCAGTLAVAGAASVTGVLTTTAQATLNGGSIALGWYRSQGQVGWYSETYGGGIYMIDTTWVRTYGSKALYVANEIAATGNITAYYSDQRLKENLKVIPNALDTVKSWTGYTYNANVVAQSFGYDPEKKEIGLLAQDVQRTTPEAVEQAPFDRHAIKGKSLTGKNYLTLKYDRLVPVLVEAIKEQDVQIQELKAQVQALLEAMKK